MNGNWCLDHPIQTANCSEVESGHPTITYPAGGACNKSKTVPDFGALPCFRFCGNDAGHTVSQCLAGWHTVDGLTCDIPSVYCVTDCAACP